MPLPFQGPELNRVLPLIPGKGILTNRDQVLCELHLGGWPAHLESSSDETALPAAFALSLSCFVSLSFLASPLFSRSSSHSFSCLFGFLFISGLFELLSLSLALCLPIFNSHFLLNVFTCLSLFSPPSGFVILPSMCLYLSLGQKHLHVKLTLSVPSRRLLSFPTYEAVLIACLRLVTTPPAPHPEPSSGFLGPLFTWEDGPLCACQIHLPPCPCCLSSEEEEAGVRPPVGGAPSARPHCARMRISAQRRSAVLSFVAQRAEIQRGSRLHGGGKD